jgi:hypothetical protein
MKDNKYIKLVILVCIFYLKIFAQNANYVYKQADPSNGGTSNLAAFNNDIQDVAINYNTGVGNINIPIYSISNGPLSLPISLNYATSGIKVDQPASDCGLGWQLAAGGNISRVVKGIADEKFYLKTNAASVTERNLVFNSQLEKNYYSSSWYNYNNQTAYKMSNMNDCQTNFRVRDAEPDLFTLNIPGKSINFVFDLSQNPILLDNSYDIKITFQSNAFTVLDENGIKYSFSSNDAEKMEVNTVNSSATTYNHISGRNFINVDSEGDVVSCYGSPTEYINTNWKLTKIETPDGKYSIDFEYENYISRMIGSANLIYNIDQTTNLPHAPFLIHAFYPNTPNINIGTYFSTNWLDRQCKRLKKINWKNGSVVNGYVTFESNTVRLDIEDQFSFEKSMDFIKIFNSQNTELKRFAFNYSYFNSAVSAPDSWLLWQNKKLKLNSITEFSSDLIAKPAFQFEYDPTPIAIKLSYQQDYWGYYNGNNASTMQGVIYHNPNYSNTNTADFALWSPFCIYPLNLPGSGGAGAYTTINGANRLPNLSYTKAGVLTKVTYPTGGSLSLEYEANTFCVDNDLTNRLAGGLRLKTTTIYDGLNHANDILKNFYYTVSGASLSGGVPRSSGKINFLPSMGYYSRYNRTNGDPLIYPYPLTYLYDCYKISAFDLASSLTGNESRVYYDEVKVEEPGKGYTIYKYNNYGTFGYNNDVLFSSSPIIQKVKTQTASYVCPSYNTPVGGEIYSEAEYLYKNTNYPYAPEPNIEWALGELKEVNIYDQSSILKSKKVYNYTIKSLNKVHGYITTSKAIFDRNMPRTESIALSKFNYLSICKVLNDETEYLYDPANASFSLSKTTNYEYNSTKHKFLTAQTTLDSKGNSYRNEFTYVADYDIFPGSTPTDNATLAIYNMKLNHELNAPIENTSWVTKSSVKYLIGGTLNIYKDFNNTITQNPTPPMGYTDVITNNPVCNKINEQYVFEIQSPLPVSGYLPFGFGVTSGHTYSAKDSRYKRKITFEKYDVYGNAIQVKKENGLRASSIYAYNNSLPVASVTNAMSTEIAHTSFEDVSNFSVNSSRIISTDNYNGNKCYDMFPAINVTTPNYDITIDLSGSSNQLNQNGKYTFSCWAKTEAGMAANKAYITIYTNDGINLGTIFPISNSFAYQSITIPNSSTWKFFKVEIDLAKIRQASPTMPANQILSLRAFFVNNSTTHHFFVDEVRLCPSNSFMETSTYNPLIGVTSKTDAKNYSEFYEYDTFLRQKLVRDFKKNIISKTNYNYKP